MIPEAIRWLGERWPARQRELRREYRLLWQSSPLVRADLRQYCLAAESAFEADPHLHAYNAGKRDVWLHIGHMAGLDQDDIGPLLEELRHEREAAGRQARREAERPDDIFDQFD